MLSNRNGESVAVRFHGKNGEFLEVENQKHFDSAMRMLGSTGALGNWKNLAYLAGASQFDVGNMLLMARIVLGRKIIGTNVDGYRLELAKKVRRRFFGFDAESFSVTFRERELRFGAEQVESLFLINEIFIKNQYNLSDANVRGKVVVDAGANLGFFSLMCAAMGAKKVYAFEPVSYTCGLLAGNVERNGFSGTIIPVKKALGEGDGEAKVCFTEGGHAGATVNPDKCDGTLESIGVVSLDGFLKGERVDFIKMDVEGYEENALVGAASTIKKHKPVLSFSAYHKPTDKQRLPQVVKNIREDYRISLNSFSEEDFYCE